MTEPDAELRRWSLRLRNLLARAYDEVEQLADLAHAAMIEDGTFPRGKDVRSVCTSVIRVLGKQGRLRPFVEQAAEDPTVAAFHGQFRELLATFPGSVAETGTEPPRPPSAPGPLRHLPRTTLTLDDEAHKELGEVLEQLSAQGCLPDESELVGLVWTAMRETGPMAAGDLADAMPNVAAVIGVLDARLPNGAGAIPPVLAFVEYLAAGRYRTPDPFTGTGDARPRLWAVVDGAAARLRVAPATIERVRDAARDSLPEVGHAKVYVALHETTGGGIRPEAWLYREGMVASFKHEAEADYGPDRYRTAAEDMVARVGPLLSGVPLEAVRFEFAVSWHRLCEPVDEWQLDGNRALGVHAEVGLRLLDQLRSPYANLEWQERSRRLRGPQRNMSRKLVRTLAANERPGVGLRKDDPVVCLVVPQPHHPRTSWPDANPLFDAISAGLPVAVWLREGGDPRGVTQWIRKLLAEGGLDQISCEVRKRREKAHYRNRGDRSRHISLFYDDFETRPTRFGALRNPRLRGGAT